MNECCFCESKNWVRLLTFWENVFEKWTFEILLYCNAKYPFNYETYLSVAGAVEKVCVSVIGCLYFSGHIKPAQTILDLPFRGVSSPPFHITGWVGSEDEGALCPCLNEQKIKLVLPLTAELTLETSRWGYAETNGCRHELMTMHNRRDLIIQGCFYMENSFFKKNKFKLYLHYLLYRVVRKNTGNMCHEKRGKKNCICMCVVLHHGHLVLFISWLSFLKILE